MERKIAFEFSCGQSRYSDKACDYVLADIEMASGRWYQLYAETTDISYYDESGKVIGNEWINYNPLCRELLRLAAELGIPEEAFAVSWEEEEPEEEPDIESSICCDGTMLYDDYETKEDLSMYQVAWEDFQKEKVI